ncbi:MAG: hypothetical protein HC852_01790 [Acaryochloridaceae cyanobacterium RU_4_10]|nr:hypothetical protein [Acaryochloridaceae cyanobacterium RU_4_10]
MKDLDIVIRELTRNDYRDARIMRTDAVPNSIDPESYSVYRKVGQTIIPGQCLGVSKAALMTLARSGALRQGNDPTYGNCWTAACTVDKYLVSQQETAR